MNSKSRATFQRAVFHLRRGIAGALSGVCDLAVGLFHTLDGARIALFGLMAEQRARRRHRA